MAATEAVSNATGTPVLEALFQACDDDGDGAVSRRDIEATLRKLAGKHQGSRAAFAVADQNGDGALQLEEFVAALSKSAHISSLPQTGYFAQHGLGAFLLEMARGVDRAAPLDPYVWMMEYMAKHRPRGSTFRTPHGMEPAAQPPSAVGDSQIVRVNISAVLKKSPKKLLDRILDQPGWQPIESADDKKSDIYFTWDSKSFLERLGHPSCRGCGAVPRLPEDAWINRLPGMGHLCDKVNMALSLRLLQKLWPEKFRFWPKSWLLPDETEKLKAWLLKHRGETVIVKPADGSLGEGIFLVQSDRDLDVKLSAKAHWGAGFGALAQRYLPKPLLIDGIKFDLRLYVVVKSTDPLEAFLCHEGLARFCTTKYEAPTAANASQHYMHLTNYSVNKKSLGFVKACDPFDVESKSSKRPLSTLLRQIEAQEAAAGRVFKEGEFFNRCKEVAIVVLQAIAPVLNVTYARVSKESKPKPKAKPKVKAKARPKKKMSDDSEEDSEDGDDDEDEEDENLPQPYCFQIVGVDVLLDEKLQPWLLEINGRPSMDIEEPVRMSEAPEGMRTCVCRDMDGEDHVHLPSVVDVHVKTLAMRGAFEIVLGRPVPDTYSALDFTGVGSDELQDTLNSIAQLYQIAGGAEKAFTTYGARRALAGAIKEGLNPVDLDSAVSRWKHQGYRQTGDLEKDTAEIGVLDFADLLQEVAVLRKSEEEEPLDALSSLIDACDFE